MTKEQFIKDLYADVKDEGHGWYTIYIYLKGELIKTIKK